MATFELNTYEAEPSPGSIGGVRVKLGWGDGPLPSREFDARTTEEAFAQLEAYRVEAEATGMVLAVSISHRAGRKPAGFDAARKGKSFIGVNV